MQWHSALHAHVFEALHSDCTHHSALGSCFSTHQPSHSSAVATQTHRTYVRTTISSRYYTCATLEMGGFEYTSLDLTIAPTMRFCSSARRHYWAGPINRYTTSLRCSATLVHLEPPPALRSGLPRDWSSGVPSSRRGEASPTASTRGRASLTALRERAR